MPLDTKSRVKGGSKLVKEQAGALVRAAPRNPSPPQTHQQRGTVGRNTEDRSGAITNRPQRRRKQHHKALSQGNPATKPDGLPRGPGRVEQQKPRCRPVDVEERSGSAAKRRVVSPRSSPIELSQHQDGPARFPTPSCLMGMEPCLIRSQDERSSRY